MSKPKRLYETKAERARRLPVGTWFVWPDTLPRRYKHYQPRVYRVLEGGKSSSRVYEDFGVWEHEGGVNSPQEAYERADDIARTLNSINADERAARAYVKRIKQERQRTATAALAAELFRH